MKRGLCSYALGAWLLCACDVATVAQVPSNVAQNQCAADSDCPGGSCVDGQCESHDGTFQTVLFEVTPPSGTSASADLQFLKTVGDMPTTGGDWDLPLDAVSQLVGGEVKLLPRKCVTTFDNNGNLLARSADLSVPGTISLTPSQQQLGVFSQSAVAQATLVNQTTFSFSMNVPPRITTSTTSLSTSSTTAASFRRSCCAISRRSSLARKRSVSRCPSPRRSNAT